MHKGFSQQLRALGSSPARLVLQCQDRWCKLCPAAALQPGGRQAMPAFTWGTANSSANPLERGEIWSPAEKLRGILTKGIYLPFVSCLDCAQAKSSTTRGEQQSHVLELTARERQGAEHGSGKTPIYTSQHVEICDLSKSVPFPSAKHQVAVRHAFP